MNDNKRIILINGDSTKWYEQAIFIVKRNAAQNELPVDFVKEAEKIINSYLGGMGNSAVSSGFPLAVTAPRIKKYRRFNFMLNLILLIMFVAFATILAYAIIL